ncbi:hypothetical protein WJX72_006707 [[Myrmecia] bisecta]|uniref:Uncharacterized protein n=1 Tax=[Myrmecia] bisecta TaxID=41462 RepID=A0AAW1QRV8_9CHLO
MVLSKAAGIAAPIYFKHAVDALQHSSAHSAAKAAMVALLLSGACRVVAGICKEMQHPIFSPVSQAAGRSMAFGAFSHVLHLDVGFHLERRTGALSRILERGTRSVAILFRAICFTFIPTAIELVLVCHLLAATFRPLVAGLVLATFVAYVAWTTALTQAATDVRKRTIELDNLTTGKAVDVLLNYETVKLFNNEALELQAYDEYLVGYQQASVSTEAISATLNAGQAVILAVGLTAVMVAGLFGGPAAAKPFSAGELVLAQGLLLQLWGPLSFLGWFYRELRQSLVDMEAFFAILQTKAALPDGTQRLDVPVDRSGSNAGGGNGAVLLDKPTLPTISGEHAAASQYADRIERSNGASSSSCVRGLAVEMKGVHFGYSKDREVLKGLDLKIEPGQSCAIVGPSGSGKSTLLRLIMRLYDVTKGAVLLDGHDVRSLVQASLRSCVAVVPQDTVLFNSTIRENIAYGRPTASREEIEQAAQMAQLTSAIKRMPDGYDTVVGERGLKLSGGEKQRVAIARAFLRAPRLLIGDESTSALDTATERGIMASLKELAAGRTSIFVAHRLSTIKDCDKIVVMSGGVVVEQGTHEELLAGGQVYYDMWQTQAANDERLASLCPCPINGVPESEDSEALIAELHETL